LHCNSRDCSQPAKKFHAFPFFQLPISINSDLFRISDFGFPAPLDNVSVDVSFADKNGNPVHATSDPNDLTAKFFIRYQTGSGLPSSISGGTSAQILWLIIPTPGSPGQVASGELYFGGATLRYWASGVTNEVAVSPDSILVKPVPDLTFDYFLPAEVYGDDPYTAAEEMPVPFSLGVRVKNSGYGYARALKINSAQPRIVENELGLLVDFRILGSEVNGNPATTSLLAHHAYGSVRIPGNHHQHERTSLLPSPRLTCCESSRARKNCRAAGWFIRVPAVSSGQKSAAVTKISRNNARASSVLAMCWRKPSRSKIITNRTR